MWDHPLIERIWANTMPIPESGCYVWLGALQKGYGRIGFRGKVPRVHRVVYELLVGPVPDGLELDHQCRVRSCWRPDHLEIVTSAINTLRGNSFAGLNARKTHCKHGHVFDAANTIWRPSGGRKCRACVVASDLKRRVVGSPGTPHIATPRHP